MATKRKIAVITGTRAEYGILRPVMNAINESQKLELALIVTGTHLFEEFGHTVDEIEKDGFPIAARIKELHKKDSLHEMAQSIGRLTEKLAQALDTIKPDILLLLGDRGEMLAGAVAATYMNIPIAHCHGGELSGNVDEPVRHAVTKLAHIHFPATEKSAERIIRMGEEEWRVFVTGAPALDTILNVQLPGKESLSQKYDFDFNKPYILVVQHPVTSELEDSREQFETTMDAALEQKIPVVITYPNADAGGRRIIESIKKLEGQPNIKTFKSLPHRDYLAVMKHSRVMVGNSSSGIIEAPSFSVPVVNIGTRQKGRERGENVLDVDNDYGQIKKAIEKSLNDKKFLSLLKNSTNPYGKGDASRKIVKVLAEINIDNRLINKRMVY